MNKTGIELIAQERQDQIEKYGHSLELDKGDHNRHGELAAAAASCVLGSPCGSPFSWVTSFFKKMEWKISARTNTYKEYKIEMLKIAGALIAAEIDRLLSVKENQNEKE